MYKLLVSILFLSMLSANLWAQNDGDTWEDETTEEFNRKLDSIQESLDDAFEVEDEEEPANDTFYEEDAQDLRGKNAKLELREVNEEKWAKLKRDKRFIYKKKKPKKRKKRKKRDSSWVSGLGDFFNSGFFSLLLYVSLAAFLIYIIYLFIKNNNISFRKNVKDQEIVQEDPWEDVQHFDDWELALEKAIRAGDYRLATRIYYLQTLQILDKKDIVKYREDKTNWYYVQKLFNSDWHDDFMELTKSFDYIWYGEYQIELEQFELLQTQFQNFHIRIG